MAPKPGDDRAGDQAMAKFKKGDRVRAVSNISRGLPAGSVGTVVEDDSPSPFVDWDGYNGGHGTTFLDNRRSVLSAEECDLVLDSVTEAVSAALEPILEILIAAGRITREQVDAARLLVEG